MELSEVEERKNKQIAELMKNHEKAFSEIKSYYNDITLNNLALISSLKVWEKYWYVYVEQIL
jgi:Mg2+ and Co2+ transporter CorA